MFSHKALKTAGPHMVTHILLQVFRSCILCLLEEVETRTCMDGEKES